MALIKGLLVIVLFLPACFPAFAQTNPYGTVSLAGEISRLEGLVQSAAPQEQYNALMTLARLYQLSGDADAQLRSLERLLALFPGDGQVLLEQGRLFLSIGEHEKAATVAAVLLSLEKQYLLEGRYLLAQIEAFRSGNTRLLEALLDDDDFSSHKGGIYYTLWKLSDDSAWMSRLRSEFPQSPEAQIAVNAIASPVTPLWLLYPGRDSIQLAAPSPVMPAAGQTQTTVLQTGLFGSEGNASALAERIRRAGFEPETSRRHVNGNDFWAVTVPAGSDINATIQRLRTAGFESFPIVRE